MIPSNKLLALFLAAASINALPVPKAQTPDFHTLETCSGDGTISCSADGSEFYMCNFGKSMPMGKVAAGTTCKGGKIMALDSGAMPPQMPAPTTMASPTSMMEPTMAPKPTSAAPEPVVTQEPEQDTITSTITTIEEAKITSTSTIKVTVTGPPPVDTNVETLPSVTMATSVPAAEPTSQTAAQPTEVPTTGNKLSITEDIILKIAPNSASCANPSPDDLDGCGTAKVATPEIIASFDKYKIETIGEAAALISIMVYESAGFKFNKNVSQKRAGQGTKAMLMPPYIIEYAQTFGSTDSIAPGLTSENISKQTPAIQDDVLALVKGDDKTYGAAAWFYSAHCDDNVKAGLRATPVTVAAWTKYLEVCVGTSVGDRLPGFVTAVTALGGTTPV
ncbi:hypothetical protein H072_5082 [Dactylellina haptotyla CBS 200.50]|uniref:Uncharacterized protein n=1 Tax=Dactylellina haptotyla (strain CBS 200.50) TaxID=1284197 RepID=S8ADE8_DACHA|nr:hypothetical protein H072_5082 [Dactylellina haptotyla CBS 200.50]